MLKVKSNLFHYPSYFTISSAFMDDNNIGGRMYLGSAGCYTKRLLPDNIKDYK